MGNRLRPLCWPVLLVVAVVVTGLVTPAFAAQRLDIETRGGQARLSVDAVDLRELLQQLAAQGNFKLWLSAAVPAQPVSADIALAPLDQVLRQVLADNSFALVYGADGQVSALYVLPRGEHQPVRQIIDDEPADLREQILQDALSSNLLSDQMKAAMLKEYHDDAESMQRVLTAQRPAAILQLIESLRRMGAPSSATLQQLEQTLARERELQPEQHPVTPFPYPQ